MRQSLMLYVANIPNTGVSNPPCSLTTTVRVRLLFAFTLSCATSIHVSLVANIAHDSIDLVLIKFNTSFV